MKLWHYKLIEKLPDKELIKQFNVCCYLRGEGLEKKEIDYVSKNPYYKIYYFHIQVMVEMVKRKLKFNFVWYYSHYRGSKLGNDISKITQIPKLDIFFPYNEHDDTYYFQCKKKLKELT